MSEIDLQLGGGYTYQWESAILLALNYLLDPAFRYNPEIHQLVEQFLGQVVAVHLEGKKANEVNVDLQDVNLLGTDRVVCIQVKAKEAEGDHWVPSDPLLAKALYRFYCNQAIEQEDPPVRFAFLSNRGFNADLVRLKHSIAASEVTNSTQGDALFRQVQRYVIRNYSPAPSLDRSRFDRTLSLLTLVEFLPIESVVANIQAKLQALHIDNWQQAYEHLYTEFSKGSVRKRGTRISGGDLRARLAPFMRPMSQLPVAPIALSQLPPDVSDFTGRQQEMAALISLLEQTSRARGTAVVVSAVAGMPGVGKSALAIHAAHLLQKRFPDAQLYANLRGVENQPQNFFNVLGSFIRALGVDAAAIPEDSNERMALYRSLMSGKQALVLLDNAFEEGQVRPLIPGSSTCAVIVTSRRRLSALEGASLIDLAVMREAEALELLERLAGRERSQPETDVAREIAGLCGYLPLAIRIAGGKLKNKSHWSFAQYASQLGHERKRLEQLQVGDLSIRASFEISYRDLNTADARLFRLLALQIESSFTPEAVAALTETMTATAWESLERLVDLQLLEPAGGGRYHFHDLMRLFAKEKSEEKESTEEQQAARSRIEKWYLLTSDVHFYIQAAVLDQYSHSPNPMANPEMVEFIVAQLIAREEFRSYFFRSGPSAAWASILWDHRFFDAPPSLQGSKGGYVVPRWDVQEYLASVASQVPDIVVAHVNSLSGHERYIAKAIQLLSLIPAEMAGEAAERVVEWLADAELAQRISAEGDDLLVHLAKGGQHSFAFDLFRELTDPIPSTVVEDGTFTWGGRARSKLRKRWDSSESLPEGLGLLKEVDIQQVVEILENHLGKAMRLEAEATRSRSVVLESWWRQAITDPGRELDFNHKNQLLDALRDALEDWIHRDAKAVDPLIARYLGDEREILRRLGLYLLYRFPAEYQKHLRNELLNADHLDDNYVRFEFFPLLQNGYPYLDAADQEALVGAILTGPPADTMQLVAQRARHFPSADPDEYVEYHAKQWIRDRLWMLKEHLPDPAATRLDELVSELGTPQPLAAGRVSGGAYVVQEISPITQQEIVEMSPDELLNFLQSWQPEPDARWGPKRVSHGGLGTAMASVVMNRPQHYNETLVPIAVLHPAYANALLTGFRENERAASIPWDLILDFCEQLLNRISVVHSSDESYKQAWIGVRREIVWLLQEGLTNSDRPLPGESLPKARDILLRLIDDPDPDLTADRPPEGWHGHNDPATLAINHIRSSALLGLVEYARFRELTAEGHGQSSSLAAEPSSERLEPLVRDALTRKLNRQEDPSWAVHSVYGRCLGLLYWLDQEWVEAHLDQIFPEQDDEESIRLFVAAWDSFVLFGYFYPSGFEMLRPKYRRAIRNLRRGYVTDSHLEPVKGLASHLLWEYLLADYGLYPRGDKESLIIEFFDEAPSDARGTAAWMLWRIIKENPSEMESYWPRVRLLWESRMNAAAKASHSTDFDSEMEWFALIPLLAPATETISTMWPLLEGLLPHITRSEDRFMGWESVEEYLAREVDQDPVRVIDLYHLMNEQVALPQWFHPREEARKILETAAAHPDSRDDALSLIDMLARKGVHTYRDIYERYAR